MKRKIDNIREMLKQRPKFTSYRGYIHEVEDAIDDAQKELRELETLLKQLEFQEECYQENLDREE